MPPHAAVDFSTATPSDQTWEVVDLYAPSGRDYVQVAPVGGLAKGETVILQQRMNREWVRLLGMDSFPTSSGKLPIPSWNPDDYVFHFERKITRIAGGRVYFESPLVNPIFAQFGSAPVVQTYTNPIGSQTAAWKTSAW